MIFNVHFNSELFIRRAFYSRLAHLFATNLVRKMTEVKHIPTSAIRSAGDPVPRGLKKM